MMMISAHLGQIVFLKNLLQLFFFICFPKKKIPISLGIKNTKMNVINT